MRTYIIQYINHDDDLCIIRLKADSYEEAKGKLRADYHDIKDLLKIKISRD
jgi:hypothetical protein